MTQLAQREIAQTAGTTWQQDAYRDLAERLSPPSAFPCTFSQNAFRRELIQFSFVETLDDCGLRMATEDLLDYVKDCEKWDGRVNTAKPFLMVFSENLARFDTVEQYHDFGWRMLQHWHDVDPRAWPSTVATKPEEPFWSFCFGGMQLFVNMSAPAHRRRKSRNLGRHFTMVINPRERFDIVAGDSIEGQKIRAKIRQRVADYDDAPHSPLLGSYQKGELEWVQYALPEENSAAVGRCPLRFRG